MIKVSTAVKEVYPDVKFDIMKAYGFQANAGRFQMDTLKENERMKRHHKEYHLLLTAGHDLDQIYGDHRTADSGS